MQDWASKRPKRIYLGTWGIRYWNSPASPVLNLFRSLTLRKMDVQILVGYGNSNDAARSASAAGQFKRLNFRYSNQSHAKYAVAEFEQHTEGAIGSWNLSDSSQLNLGIQLTQGQAAKLAVIHRNCWANAVEKEILFARFKNLGPLAETIYQPNDTKESVRL